MPGTTPLPTDATLFMERNALDFEPSRLSAISLWNDGDGGIALAEAAEEPCGTTP